MSETSTASITRPASVTSAVKLMYAVFGIGILRSMLEFQSVAESVPINVAITTWLSVSVIMLLLIYSIGCGRNWARITFLVLFAVGAPFAVQPLLHTLSAHLISGLLGIMQMTGQITALVLLFQPASSAWFHRSKKPGKKTESVEF